MFSKLGVAGLSPMFSRSSNVFEVEVELILYLASILQFYFSSFQFCVNLVSSSSYSVWGTLVIVQIFDCRFLADLHVLGSLESKKHKISMMSGCSLVSLLVC